MKSGDFVIVYLTQMKMSGFDLTAWKSLIGFYAFASGIYLPSGGYFWKMKMPGF